MSTTILALVENTVYRPGLLAEHGLSLLIQSPHGTVLLDAGQTDAVLGNAGRLGVDLARVDRIVLSHGHFDHTGGLRSVLQQTGPRDVVMHPDALEPKYAVRDSQVRSIGAPDTRQTLEAAGARLVLSERPFEIMPGILVTGCIPRLTDFEEVPERFRVRRDGALVRDPLRDDQALVVHTDEGPVVVLGCAHAGLANTLDYVSRLLGERRFAAVVGGTHLVDAEPLRLRRTLEALASYGITRMAPCHCTGFRGQAALLGWLGERYVPLATGDRLDFRSL